MTRLLHVLGNQKVQILQTFQNKKDILCFAQLFKGSSVVLLAEDGI